MTCPKTSRPVTLKSLVACLSLALVAGCASGPKPESSATPTPMYTPHKVTVEVAHTEEMASSLHLSGQVLPTENRTVILTAPLDGVVTQPRAHVGEMLRENQILAEFNSVYGQTSMQVLDKLESTQANMMQTQAQLAQSLTSLAQARSSYGDANSKVAGLRATLAQAEADLTLAETDLRRKRELYAAGVFAKADVDQSKDTYEKARAAVAMNREQLRISQTQLPLSREVVGQASEAVDVAKDSFVLNQATNARYRSVLSQSRLVGGVIPGGLSRLQVGESHSEAAAASQSFPIRSPISGVLVEWSATAGQRIPNGTPIGKVVELSQVYVDANAFERDLGAVREGDSLQVVSPASPGKVFHGKVSYVGRQVNSDTRSVQVRSLIQNPGNVLRPNMFVEVTIERSRAAKSIVIPEKAVITLGSESFVMVEEQPDKYRKQKVALGEKSGDKIEITQGLKVGDRIVTEGNLLLDIKE